MGKIGIRAQVSMEYLIIVGFVAAITIPLILIFTSHSTEMDEQVISNQVDNIASKIVDSAESVYYLGESSKVTFRVYIPKKINSITIGNNEVVFYVSKLVGVDEVVKYCPVPINGSLSTTAGIYDIVVESKGDYVWVSN
ncbi:hypothetical protein KY332_03020 [Candidatus Woesearchaeota archaeon]|nr:hypothetical protein [Candidatus Woesearchaeota archaeon]